MKIEKTCPVCSKKYTVYQSQLKRVPLAYCSMECRKISTKERNKKLTHPDLTRRLDYDPITGIFTYKKNYGVVPGEASGWVDDLGYIHVRIGRKLYLAHRLAWFYIHGVWPKTYLDHKDGNPTNNAIANLREATQSQNLYNSKLSTLNKSGRKGVCWDKSRNKWRSTIRAEGKWKQVGRFDHFCMAVKARREIEKDWHGEFARSAA